MASRLFAFGSFVFDTERAILTRDGVAVPVGARGQALLDSLLRAGGEAVGKAALMDAAWPGVIVEESNLSVQIAAVRKLLGSTPEGGEWIATVPRVGYRLAGALGAETRTAPEHREGRAYSTSKPTIAVLPFTNVSGDK